MNKSDWAVIFVALAVTALVIGGWFVVINGFRARTAAIDKRLERLEHAAFEKEVAP